MIRGYHVYQSIWTPVIGEELCCARELSNPQDPFAVKITKGGSTVGHIPRKISSVCAVFLQKGGTIDCVVTAARRYSADLPQGGLEIPCILNFSGNENDIDKVQKLLKFAEIPVPVPAAVEPVESDEEGLPSSKKEKLMDMSDELDSIEKGEKLTDLHINYAQQLIKCQFPSLNGLQSTLYQVKKPAFKPLKDQLQIIHSRGDHWIVASTVSSKDVIVFDSVYHSLDSATKDVIANLFLPDTTKIVESQKQEGGRDCGLFAIATVTAIAHGYDPSKMKFDQTAMRNHLVKCFTEKCMSMFPLV